MYENNKISVTGGLDVGFDPSIDRAFYLAVQRVFEQMAVEISRKYTVKSSIQQSIFDSREYTFALQLYVFSPEEMKEVAEKIREDERRIIMKLSRDDTKIKQKELV